MFKQHVTEESPWAAYSASSIVRIQDEGYQSRYALKKGKAKNFSFK